jgi:hypothetical protein
MQLVRYVPIPDVLGMRSSASHTRDVPYATSSASGVGDGADAREQLL